MAGKKGAPSGSARARTSGNRTNGRNRPDKAPNTRHDRDAEQAFLSDHERRHQQRVLDVFRDAFGEVLSSPNLTATLRSVKQALFDRDFARAFGDPDHVSMYAARWSPTRALCYASVLSGLREYLEPLAPSSLPADTTQADEDEGDDEGTEPPRSLKVLSIGGGAAELVAFAAFLGASSSPGSITLLDSGPWDAVIAQLTTTLTTPPPLSKYASAAAKLSNAAMIPASRFTSAFLQHDALTLGRERLSSLVGDAPLLVTILFTLNELFTAGGIGKTTAFLLDLTSTVPVGSLLLIVDSPGSYSETSVGKDAKRYPMQWLLDRIMLGTRGEPVNGRRWAKLESQDSVWFRLADALDYPIPLENMRFQMHLYRAEDAGLGDGD